MSNETIQAIERAIKSNKAAVEFGAALNRLQVNRDFNAVVTTGYFEREAVRLVHLKSDPNMQSADSQRAIISQMDAIGALKQYLATVKHLTMLAEKTLSADEVTLEELAEETL